MNRAVFSSDEFPAELNDDARLAHWRDIHDDIYCGIDLYRPEDRPFSIRFEFAQFGAVSVGKFEGTVRRMVRRREAVSSDANDDFSFGLNCGPSSLSIIRPGGESLLAHGSGILTSNVDVGDVQGGSENAWFAVNIPRRLVEYLVVRPHDLLGSAIDASSEPLRHLARYLNVLTGPQSEIGDPQLAASIGAMLTDLVALALGAFGDAAEVSRMRGLRAARLQEIVATIRAGFLSPAFSARSVATQLGLSPRYIQDLLQETGASFTDHVIELRLQHARRMLASRRYDAFKIIDIVYTCGFSDVSCFNRQFRRRFEMSPTELRRQAEQ